MSDDFERQLQELDAKKDNIIHSEFMSKQKQIIEQIEKSTEQLEKDTNAKGDE